MSVSVTFVAQRRRALALRRCGSHEKARTSEAKPTSVRVEARISRWGGQKSCGKWAENPVCCGRLYLDRIDCDVYLQLRLQRF